jgi:TPR repeat protein
MNLVGRCFEQGWGAAADRAEARHWYRRSAEAGYFRGQYNYASALTADGRPWEATAWFEAALAGAPAASRAVMAQALAQSAVAAHRALAEAAELVPC